MKVNKGSEDISPNFAYDDGVFTYLGFDSTKSFPAVFSYEKGKEGILNTHIKKDGNYDVLVVHQVLPQILLRSGDKVVGVFNKGYAKNPVRQTRQTSNDNEVERVLLDEKAEKQRQMIEDTQKTLKSIVNRVGDERLKWLMDMENYYDQICKLQSSFLNSISDARKGWNDDVQKNYYAHYLELIDKDSKTYASEVKEYMEKLDETRFKIERLVNPIPLPQKINEREY